MFKLLLSPFTALRLFFKVAGAKGGILFLLGVAVGLLVAQESGAELRAKLQARAEGRDPGVPQDEDLSL